MDTRSKNSRKLRIALGILLIIIVTIVNFFIYPIIGVNAEAEYLKVRQEQGIDEGYMSELVQGSYELYYELTKSEVEYPFFMREMLASWTGYFAELKYGIDYLIKSDELMDWNTPMKLEQVLMGERADRDDITELKEWYQYYFVLSIFIIIHFPTGE